MHKTHLLIFTQLLNFTVIKTVLLMLELGVELYVSTPTLYFKNGSYH